MSIFRKNRVKNEAVTEKPSQNGAAGKATENGTVVYESQFIAAARQYCVDHGWLSEDGRCLIEVADDAEIIDFLVKISHQIWDVPVPGLRLQQRIDAVLQLNASSLEFRIAVLWCLTEAAFPNVDFRLALSPTGMYNNLIDFLLKQFEQKHLEFQLVYDLIVEVEYPYPILVWLDETGEEIDHFDPLQTLLPEGKRLIYHQEELILIENLGKYLDVLFALMFWFNSDGTEAEEKKNQANMLYPNHPFLLILEYKKGFEGNVPVKYFELGTRPRLEMLTALVELGLKYPNDTNVKEYYKRAKEMLAGFYGQEFLNAVTNAIKNKKNK